MNVLVTGTAGFIGFHVARHLLERGETVCGVDSVNSYYSPVLKETRLSQLRKFRGFAEQRIDIADAPALADVFHRHAPKQVIHLAAQAGVRYSVSHPQEYLTSNLIGFGHVLECCRNHQIEHLVYASTSSVYGEAKSGDFRPFKESQPVGHPLSLYAATKSANESMAHSYAHLHGLPCTGLRLFTVYGPWGRPDMALFSFTESLLSGQPLKLYNHGRMVRDFTYIDDVVDGILRVLDIPASAEPMAAADAPHISAIAPFRIYNVGRGQPVELITYVEALEKVTRRTAQKILQPIQPGDVPATWADISLVQQATGYQPKTNVSQGVEEFWRWYQQYQSK